MEIIRKIVHILASICYVAIIIYILILLPMIIGYRPLVVLSGSMEPKYKVGSVIYFEKNLDIKEDDIIVFTMRDAEYVTHRVVRIDNGKYITNGDANEFTDPEKVELQAIKGKALDFNIPIIGYYIYYVNTHFWIIVVIVLILVSEFLLSNIRAVDREDEVALEGGRRKYEK